MNIPKTMLALITAVLLSGCEDKPQQVTIEFMHSAVEQERQTVIAGIINRFQQENPDIIVKQVPVEEDAYNTKSLPLPAQDHCRRSSRSAMTMPKSWIKSSLSTTKL